MQKMEIGGYGLSALSLFQWHKVFGKLDYFLSEFCILLQRFHFACRKVCQRKHQGSK